MYRLFNQYFELGFWVAALIALAVTNPYAPAHFSLCPLKLLKITWCPGCGLGHAIGFLFRGDISSSLKAHWLGIPATVIIVQRIFSLSRKQLLNSDWSKLFVH